MQPSPIGITEISHFRAPYKDAYFAGLGGIGRPVHAPDYVKSAQGYGVYQGVGEDDDAGGGDEDLPKLRGDWAQGKGGLMAMWGQNPWGPGGRHIEGYGRGGADQMAGYGRTLPPEISGYGRSVASRSAIDGFGYGRGGAMHGYGYGRRSVMAGFGVISDPGLTADPPIKALDPYFTVNQAITYATPATATGLDTLLAQFGSTDQAFAVTDASGKTVTIIFYHGMTQPPPGSEPGPYAPFQTVYMTAANALIAKYGHNMMTLVDKRLVMPTPGKRSIVLTADPQVVANLTHPGGAYFITQDEVAPVLLGQAQVIAKTLQKAGFWSGPFGIALGIAAVGGVVYAITGKKKKRAA